jgi:hypothetical protein
METKKLIQKHRKQIAILKMIQNSENRFNEHLKMVKQHINVDWHFKRAKINLDIKERLTAYYFRL